jgi:hypothetical protein
MPNSTTGDGGSSASAQSKSDFVTFWTTLPGILTGVAALLTAVVGLLAALNVFRTTTPAAAPPASTAISSSAGGQSTTPSSEPVGGALVIRRGTVSMSSSERVSLRTGQIISGVLDSDLYLSCGGTTCLLERNLVQVPSAGSKEACSAALRQRTLETLEVTSLQPGAEVCVETHDSGIAGLRLSQIPGPGSSQLVFDYTLWQ